MTRPISKKEYQMAQNRAFYAKRSIDGYYYNFFIPTKKLSPPVIKAYQAINSICPIKNKDAMLNILYNLYLSFLSERALHNDYRENWIAICMNSNYYTGRNKLYPHYSYRNIFNAINYLVKENFIEKRKGYKNIKRYTLYKPTQKLKEVFALYSDIPVEDIINKMPVYIRGSNGNIITPKDYISINKMIDNINMINAVNRLYTLSYKNEKINGIYMGNVEQNDLNARFCLDFNEFFLIRIFHKNLANGGRFFYPFISCPKEWRKTILINDKPATEIDYSNTFIALIYNYYLGIDCPNDLYSIKGFDRFDVKIMTNILINCDSTKSAIHAITRKANKDKKAKGDKSNYKNFGNGDGYASKLVKAILYKHSLIKNWIGKKGIAGKLMAIESSIAEKVMMEFAVRQWFILPIHDSFVVESEHREFLIETMKEKWEEKMGFSPMVKIAF